MVMSSIQLPLNPLNEGEQYKDTRKSRFPPAREWQNKNMRLIHLMFLFILDKEIVKIILTDEYFL